jgi:chromosome segregation ATPase
MQDNVTCDFVHWIDDVWPNSLCKSLRKLWDMYTETKDGRVREALNYCESKFMYQDQITKLHRDLKNAQDELQQVVEEKQVTLALKAKAEQALIEANAELEEKKKMGACTTNMHKCLRLKAEKDREQLKGEKRKLEYIIGDLLRQKERARSRISQIKASCDEIYD